MKGRTRGAARDSPGAEETHASLYIHDIVLAFGAEKHYINRFG